MGMYLFHHLLIYSTTATFLSHRTIKNSYKAIHFFHIPSHNYQQPVGFAGLLMPEFGLSESLLNTVVILFVFANNYPNID
jgi:hypothetical protein